jgi:hypothetical protein
LVLNTKAGPSVAKADVPRVRLFSLLEKLHTDLFLIEKRSPEIYVIRKYLILEATSMQESLPEILMRVVTELHDVAYLIERIEPQLLDIAGPKAMENPDTLKVLQGIDLAVQKSRGLAEFIDTITADVSSEWTVDMTTALSLVKLSEMKRALGDGLRHGHSQPLTKVAGDFDFF